MLHWCGICGVHARWPVVMLLFEQGTALIIHAAACTYVPCVQCVHATCGKAQIADKDVLCRHRALCAELAPASQHVIDAFGIPPYLQAAPIAADWEAYNKVDNQGELIGPAFE